MIGGKDKGHSGRFSGIESNSGEIFQFFNGSGVAADKISDEQKDSFVSFGGPFVFDCDREK